MRKPRRAHDFARGAERRLESDEVLSALGFERLHLLVSTLAPPAFPYSIFTSIVRALRLC